MKELRTNPALARGVEEIPVILTRTRLASADGMTSQGLHLPLGRLTGEIIGAFHEVVAELGCGYGELVHQRALKIAVCDRGLLAEDNLSIGVRFRGHDIGNFRPDLVVERLVIVEVKAVSTLDPSATAQILNYLRSAGGGTGLLVNFGSRPTVERFVVGHPPISLPLLPKDPVKDISRWLPQDVKVK